MLDTKRPEFQVKQQEAEILKTRLNISKEYKIKQFKLNTSRVIQFKRETITSSVKKNNWYLNT